MIRKFPQIAVLVVMVAGLLSTSLLAQQQQNPQERPGARQQTKPQAKVGDELTKFFATKLFLANHAEVEISQLAMKKASNEQVKQFAKMLVDEHKALNEKLTRFVPASIVKQTRDMRQSQAEPTTPRDETTTSPLTEDVADAQPPTGDPATDRTTVMRPEFETGSNEVLDKLCEISQVACQNELTATREMLNKYSGHDFDMGYLGIQIACHTQLISELKAIDGVGNDEFQKLVRSATTSVEQHLTKAETLARQLEDDTKTGSR